MNEQRAPGQHIVWIAVAVGFAAVGGYATVRFYRAQTATDVSASIAPPVEAALVPPAALDELLSKVESARRALDVGALSELEAELTREMIEAPAALVVAAKLSLCDALATRALEATIRAHGLDAAAQATATETLSQANALLGELEAAGVDPPRTRALRARLRLAAGEDVLASHPVVLMPTYRDAELRFAALARPLWAIDSPTPTPAALDELVATLRQAEPDTGLVRGLLALAHLRRGDREAAASEAGSILANVPDQPLALALQQRALAGRPELRPTAGDPLAVANAEGPKAGPAANGGPDATDPPPTPPLPPTAKPEPAAAEPAAAEPAAAEPEPEPEPAAAKPEPAQPKPTPADAAALAERGCKLVHGGDAATGYRTLLQAFDLDPSSQTVILCMAEAHAALGRDASARALSERVLRRSPKNKRALALAAALAEKRGDTGAATEFYRRLLALDPTNEKAKAYVETHDGA